jgi:hypothetical protein
LPGTSDDHLRPTARQNLLHSHATANLRARSRSLRKQLFLHARVVNAPHWFGGDSRGHKVPSKCALAVNALLEPSQLCRGWFKGLSDTQLTCFRHTPWLQRLASNAITKLNFPLNYEHARPAGSHSLSERRTSYASTYYNQVVIHLRSCRLIFA